MHRFLKLNEAVEKYLFCFLCICRCLPEYIYFVYIFHCADICAYIYIYMGVFCIYIFGCGYISIWVYTIVAVSQKLTLQVDAVI